MKSKKYNKTLLFDINTIFIYIKMAYGIAQIQDGKLQIISEVFSDLDEAKTAYLQLMNCWYQEELKIVNGAMRTPQKNTPHLIAFGNITTIHQQSNDELDEIVKIYSEFRIQNASNDEFQYNKAIEIRKVRDQKVSILINTAL